MPAVNQGVDQAGFANIGTTGEGDLGQGSRGILRFFDCTGDKFCGFDDHGSDFCLLAFGSCSLDIEIRQLTAIYSYLIKIDMFSWVINIFFDIEHRCIVCMHTNMLSSLAVCCRGKDWVTTTEKRILEKFKINSSQSIPPEGFYTAFQIYVPK